MIPVRLFFFLNTYHVDWVNKITFDADVSCAWVLENQRFQKQVAMETGVEIFPSELFSMCNVVPQCSIAMSSLTMWKSLWKLKWGKCVMNIGGKWGHIICAYSSVWQNENLEMQLCKLYTTRSYRTVATQGLWSYLHMYTQRCVCILFYVSVSMFFCLFFCKCWLYTSPLVKIWLHWTVNISESVSMHVWIWHPLCRCCDSLYKE